MLHRFCLGRCMTFRLPTLHMIPSPEIGLPYPRMPRRDGFVATPESEPSSVPANIDDVICSTSSCIILRAGSSPVVYAHISCALLCHKISLPRHIALERFRLSFCIRVSSSIPAGTEVGSTQRYGLSSDTVERDGSQRPGKRNEDCRKPGSDYDRWTQKHT